MRTPGIMLLWTSLSFAACTSSDANFGGSLPSDDLGSANQDAAATSADFGVAFDLAATGDAATSCSRCAQFSMPTDRGAVAQGLRETSGLATSRRTPGVLYGHNDSGGGTKFFAIDHSGARVATIELDGFEGNDFEDIAVGPCPSGTCIYLGDIGDNGNRRIIKTVLRIAEPALTLGGAATTIHVTPEQLPFMYPTLTLHNAETLLVHPSTGDVYVATKESPGERSTLFRFPQPHSPGQVATLIEVTRLPVPLPGDLDLSGGDIHPCTGDVLLRTSNRLYLLTLEPGQPYESVFSPPSATAPWVTTVPVAVEGNGESVAWSHDGMGYFTVSEGSGAMLHGVSCEP